MSSPSPVSQQRRRKQRLRLHKPKLYPWRDRWELERISRGLFVAISLFGHSQQEGLSVSNLDSEAQARLTRALHTVAMWKVRSDQGRIPHSMETTYSLAQLLWRDAQQCLFANTTTTTTIELRLAYAAAITRGVNGLADVLQQSRAVAASVSQLCCEQLGLPGWLVDLRHESAHNDLPTLPTLRLAAKVFLGFLQDRYWRPMMRHKWNVQQRALQLLEQYEAACDGKVLFDVSRGDDDDEEEDIIEVGSSDSSGSDDKDEGTDLWGDQRLGTSHNRFAVLLEMPRQSEEKKKVEKKPSKKPKVEANSQSNKNEAQERQQQSPEHFAKEYVKDIPLDVGYQVALSFLVWGGVGDAPEGIGGAFLSGSTITSYPETLEGVSKLQARYKPLLQTLFCAWPGFLPALLVHLVDIVLSLQAAAVERDEDLLDVASEHKISFAISWIRYLLSKEMHAQHTGTSVGFMDAGNDLTKRPSHTWTEDERSLMQSSAPRTGLETSLLPLQSLKERCTFEDDKSSLSHASRSISQLLREILEGKAPTNSEETSTMQPADEDCVFRLGKSSTDDADESHPGDPLSLEDMEALLPEDHVAKTGKESDDPESLTASSALQQETNGPATSLRNGFEDRKGQGSEKKKRRWKKCDSWDTCAIGSLPGYPV